MNKSLFLPAIMVLIAVGLYYLFPYDLAFLTHTLILIILVLSIDLILGYAGIPTLGQAALFGGGAYAAALFAIHLSANPIAGLLVGAMAGGILALISGVLVLRTNGLTAIMLTIAFAQICAEVVNRARDLTGGSDGLRVREIEPLFGLFAFDFTGQTGYWYALAVLIIVFALLSKIVNSPFGHSLRGISESPARMRAIGSPVYFRQVVAYMIGGCIAGIAGALSAQITQLVSLETLTFSLSAEALIMLILGGTGRLYGAVIGTFIFMLVHHIAAANDPFNWLFVIGAMILLVVFFLPSGLISLPSILQKQFKGGKYARS